MSDKTRVIFQNGQRQDVYLLTPEQVGEVFQIIDNGCYEPEIKLTEIEKAVCKYFKVPSLISNDRVRENVYHRQIFYYVASKTSRNTLKSIGNLLGYHHTSIIAGRNKIRNLVTGNRPDETILKDLEQINKLITPVGEK